jgi:methylglyoxal synthase
MEKFPFHRFAKIGGSRNRSKGIREEERNNTMKDNNETIQEEMILTDFAVLPQIFQGAGIRKKIALVAHDNKKQDLIEWARYNRDLLVQHDLFATGTTGRLLGETLAAPVICLQSGPLGGDLQIGSRITEGDIDLLVFFWDPLSPHPHDPDVKALLRIAVVWNIPVACDRATADYVISSPLMTEPYERQQPDYASHLERLVVEQAELTMNAEL